MYRLVYFKAKYVIGFLSGIGTKTFELDLRKFKDRNIMVIFGDNASGKSTFLSLIHPWHYPSDGRTKFIVPNKEGILIREYESDDGTLISTKCIYHPKSDGTHMPPKCFFTVTKHKKNGESEPVELNPTGNVSSYQNLLYTYFGINKEFLSFATYNNAISGIIRMTDSERKNSVNSLVPNMGRFEIAYQIVNEKYKELRNLIRNVSGKILALRDEDSIRADLKRVSKELEAYLKQKEETIKKIAKYDGRLKELTNGDDIDEILSVYNDSVHTIESLDDSCRSLVRQLNQLYDQVGIEFKPGKQSLSDLSNRVLKYEKKVAVTEAELSSYEEQQKRYREQMADIENQILELETKLYSVETQDLDDLLRMRESYLAKLKTLRYRDNDPRYDSMTYDEAISFSNNISMLSDMISTLYVEYGDLVTEYFHNIGDKGFVKQQNESLNKLQIRIETNSAKKDHIYRQLIEKEQYRKLQNILDQRPKSCTIDSCPFIANALKWETISHEIEDLKAEYEELDLDLQAAQHEATDYEKRLALNGHAQTVVSFIMPMEQQLKKYLGVTIKDVYQSIEHATWQKVLDIFKLKEIAAILSEKDLYLKITKQLLPEVESNITMVKLYDQNRNLIQQQIDRLKSDRKSIKAELSQSNMHVAISGEMLDGWKKKAFIWRKIATMSEEYADKKRDLEIMKDEVNKTSSAIEQIKELRLRRKEQKEHLKELERLIEDRSPYLHALELDILQLDQLKIEKAQLEQDFLVVDVIRSIIQPGKGLRKELINIYMYDIYQTANQLLLHTFNGNLYLKEFIITDKEFIIPYVYNGTESPDIIFASASQQSAISIAIAMAILSKIMGDYGIACFDEADGPFSPANRTIFIDILTTQIRYIGLEQCFFITQHPGEYSSEDGVGFIAFPGGSLKHISKDDIIEVK